MRAVGVQGDPSDVAGSGALVHDEERVTNDRAFAMDVSETSRNLRRPATTSGYLFRARRRRTISARAMAVVEPR
jgi:hypothetical protein